MINTTLREVNYNPEHFEPLTYEVSPINDGIEEEQLPPLVVDADKEIHKNYVAPDGCPVCGITHDEKGHRVGYQPAEWYDLKTFHLLDPATRAEMQKKSLPKLQPSIEETAGMQSVASQMKENITNYLNNAEGATAPEA